MHPLYMAGAAIAGIGGKPTLDQIQGMLTSDIDPALLGEKYNSNTKFLSLLPSAADLIDAWINKYITDNQLNVLLGFNNIPAGIKPHNAQQKVGQDAWHNIIKSKIPRLSLEQIILAYYSGYIRKDTYDRLVKQYGFNDKHISLLMDLLKPKFDGQIVGTNYLRGFKTQEETIEAIRKLYGCNELEANLIRKQTQFLPQAADIIRFSVRDVYNEDQVRRLRMDDEYSDNKELPDWARAIGLGTAEIYDKDGKKISRDILKDYWRAHWELMSPTMGYEAIHKLRANRLFRYNGIVPDVTAFTIDDLKNLLKTSDYVPGHRSWMAAITYKSLGLRDVRRTFAKGIIDKDEAYEQYLDLGYIPDDATKLVKLEEKLISDSANKKYIAKVYEGYKLGSVRKESAISLLTSFDVKTNEITANIDAIDLDVNTKLVQEYMKMVKREFFLGLYDGTECKTQLISGGMTDFRASQYVILWQRQLSRARRIASQTTVLDWYNRGLITLEDVRDRLTKLGFGNVDTIIYLEQAKQDMDKRILVEQAKIVKTEKQAAAEAARIARQEYAAHKEAQALLRTYSPLAKMGVWVKSGELSVEDAIARMTFLDIPAVDQARYLTDWGVGA